MFQEGLDQSDRNPVFQHLLMLEELADPWQLESRLLVLFQPLNLQMFDGRCFMLFICAAEVGSLPPE